MKKALSIALAATLLGGAARAQTEVLDGIAVIVNEKVITYRDVEEYIRPAVELLRRQHARQPETLRQKHLEAQRDGIEQLVERELVLHDFKVAGYNLPESVIEEEVQSRIRERYGDRLTLTKTLQAQGQTYEGFRKQIREQIVVDALRQKNVSSALIISPHKIESYYLAHQDKFKKEDQVKLRMIVINQPAAGPAGMAGRVAKQVLAKIEAGTPFAEMAAVYSEGSQRSQGGDWGWVEKSVLRKELADAAFSLQPGKVSGMVESAEAAYLMLVEERRAAGVRPLAEVRDEIEKTLLTEERARLAKSYVDRLKAKSFVRYF